MSRFIRKKRVVLFAVGTALVTVGLFTVAAIAEGESSFNELRFPPGD